MRKIAFSIFTISLLAGCASTSNKLQNQETLNAIKISESKITSEIDTLKLGLSNQSDYIESLESEVIELRSAVNTYQTAKNKAIQPDKTSNSNKRDETSESLLVAPVNEGLIVLGALENVQLKGIDTVYTARIDTGATTSSLNAVDIEEFEREGKKWVKFHIKESSADIEGKNMVEAPIIRYAKIRQPTSETLEKRAVIELWVKMGDIHEKSQFTLANRSQMSHPVLLGREFIQDIALVDVSKAFLLSKPNKTYKD